MNCEIFGRQRYLHLLRGTDKRHEPVKSVRVEDQTRNMRQECVWTVAFGKFFVLTNVTRIFISARLM
jgi:hypothetical protein